MLLRFLNVDDYLLLQNLKRQGAIPQDNVVELPLIELGPQLGLSPFGEVPGS